MLLRHGMDIVMTVKIKAISKQITSESGRLWYGIVDKETFFQLSENVEKKRATTHLHVLVICVYYLDFGKEDMNDVKSIVKQYLRKNNFDGLCHIDGECACDLSDLAPCDHISLDCEPGYKLPCECEEEHLFHITTKKPSASPVL